MTVDVRLAKLEKEIQRLNTLVLGARRDAAGGANHNLLSVTHPDTLPANVIAGDVIYGNNTPKWARRAKENDGDVLTLAAGLPTWQPGGGGGGGMEFEDNFADAAIHWAWTTWGTGATRTITEAGGVLTLHGDAGVACDFWTAGNDGPQIHIDAPQFPNTIVTKVDHDGAVPDLCEFGIFASCRINTGVANGCWILGRRRWDASGENGIFASRWGAALANVDPMITLPVWLRLRVGGGHRLRSTCYFDYSTDGAIWNNITSDSNSGQYPATYGFTHGLYIRNWSAPYPQIDAQYEFFTMTLEGGPG